MHVIPLFSDISNVTGVILGTIVLNITSDEGSETSGTALRLLFV